MVVKDIKDIILVITKYLVPIIVIITYPILMVGITIYTRISRKMKEERDRCK